MLHLEEIRTALWPRDLPSHTRVWAVLDGARDRRIYGAVDGYKGEKHCLYAGTLPWQLQMAAPYLVELERDHQFTDFILRHGWGNAWGIFLHASTGASSLRKHLRSFLRVRDQAGRKLVFRYYDPRVFRVYLPTCWTEELRAVFGPVSRFLMEDAVAASCHQFVFDGVRVIDESVRK